MFLCKHCLEQFEDADLAYTLIAETRLDHPAKDLYVMKFCSRAHLQAFLEFRNFQGQRYVLAKVSKDGSVRSFEPAPPTELIILVGSSTAS